MNRSQDYGGLSGRVSACLTIAFAVTPFCTYAQQAYNVDSLADRLAGKNVPDFTAVYACDRHFRLAGSSRAEIAIGVREAIAGSNSMLIAAGRKPVPNIEPFIAEKTDELMKQVVGYARAGHATITISQRQGKLLVRTEVPTIKEMRIFAYNGQDTMFTYRGSEARILAGFHNEFLGDFVFPGCGIGGVAMCKNLASQGAIAAGTYNCEVGLADGMQGVSEALYDRGTVTLQQIGQTLCVIGTSTLRPGVVDAYRQECTYLKYRRVCPELLLPAEIELREWFRPASTLPYGDMYDESYKLVSAISKAAPASDFEFESQLPDVALVTREDHGKSKSIRYEPGTSLDAQFKADAENKRLAALNGPSDERATGSGRVFGFAALLLAICGWLIYRRAAAMKQKA